ncbi:MAG: hypothetical protein AABN95_03695 [Acidobacteriota bacterium]
MGDEQALEPAGNQSTGSASARAPALPDINTETYPFERVQYLLDEAAYFNLYSIPEESERTAIRAGSGDGCVGFRIREKLHRFDVRVQPPVRSVGLRATNSVGERVGSMSHRWLLCPDDFAALPDRDPTPTSLDPTRQQRFVMLDGECLLGECGDGFRGFGTGTTFPASDGTLLVAAVGDVMEGRGRLKGLVGTYTYCGSLSSGEGFRGSFMLRLMDPQGVLKTEGTLPDQQSIEWPEQGITYLILRGQKKDRRAKTSYSFGPDGQVNGLAVTQQLRLIEVDASSSRRGGLRSVKSVGPVIGKMDANIAFNLFNPGAPGTGLSPIPFASYNEYHFYDRDGDTVGSFVADGGEGRTFTMELAGAPGQRALRFGGFGPLMKGTGPFSGIEGLMSDNSVVGIAPHAIMTFYVIRINDPEGKYRIQA